MATKKAPPKKAEKAEKKPAAKKGAKAESHDIASAVAAAAESSASKKAAKKPTAAEQSVSKKASAAEQSVSKRASSMKTAAAEQSASFAKKSPSSAAEQSTSFAKKPAPSAPRAGEQSASFKKAAPSAPSAAEQSASFKKAAPSAPRAAEQSGSFKKPAASAPRAPVPLKPKKPAPSAPPTWQTRPITPDLMPRGASRELEATHQLNWPAKLPDGSIIGIERGKLSESSAVRVAPDGTRTALSKPGQFSSLVVTPDGKQVYGVSGDGKVWSFPTTADASSAVVVFESKRVWGVTPIDSSRAVISEDGTVALMRTTETPWRELDEASVKPISIPLVDAVDAGRWVVVGRSPKSHLFAVYDEQLLPVQSWVQTEGGVSAVDGRAFLYTAGNTTREELLNLTEVHQTL